MAFFAGNDNHHMYLRPGHVEAEKVATVPTTDAEGKSTLKKGQSHYANSIKFSFLHANRSYALAVRVEVTYETDMAYRDIELAEKQLNFKRVGNKYIIAINEARTLEQCSHIAADLERLMKVCREEKDETKMKLIEEWSKILQARIEAIEKENAEPVNTEPEKAKTEDGGDPNEEDEEDPNDILRALKNRITPTNESSEDKAKRENFGKCCHVIGQMTMALPTDNNVIPFPDADRTPSWAPPVNEIYAQVSSRIILMMTFFV